uniref:RNA methyltransferase n=1 Tax=Zea mays TaxID=4577 RepID=A0A804NZQ8_MAIZE
MATSTEPEGAPPAAKGPKGEANTKGSNEHREVGAGSGGGSQKRKRKEVFIYGNYRNYYGYRIDRNVGEDPRLEAFKKQWFEKKDCLDIGCNQGLVTIGLAMKFKCQSILGVDIDSGLIETAKWNLRRIMRQDKVATNNVKAQKSSDSPQSSPEELASELSNGNKHQDLFKIVSFRRENFVASMDGCSEQYDTILCYVICEDLEASKTGRCFYHGASTMEFIQEKQISFRGTFREILLDKVGFRSVELLAERLVGTVSGFDRPIEVYHK